MAPLDPSSSPSALGGGLSPKGSAPTAPQPASLSHPLPAGMRDLLPAEAAEQGRLLGQVLRSFQLAGYQRVGLPVFEYADVLSRGLGAVPPTTLLRFVEPETGEVVALRPDMTPQVARLVATRLADGPFPARLCYRGSVLRRRHERARHERQVMQAGVELVGTTGLAADLEIVATIVSAVRAAGLEEFVLDLGHGALAQELLLDVEEPHRALLFEALSLKDQAEVVRRAERAGLPTGRVGELAAVVELQGGEEIFGEARALLSSGRCLRFVSELEELFRAVLEAGLAPKVVCDLGEVRAVEYYTGCLFQILAEGPGQAVASGGRYDSLLEVFGRALPAAGGAIHIDHLGWAIGSESARETRLLIVGGSAGERESVARSLRGKGVISATWGTSSEVSESPAEAAKILDYARAWRYSHVVRVDPGRSASDPSGSAPPSPLRVSRVEAEGEAALGALTFDALVELSNRAL